VDPASIAASQADFPRQEPLGIEFVDPGQSKYGEDEGVLYERLKRDGWKRQGPFGRNTRVPGKQYAIRREGDPGWLLQPGRDLPALRLYYRGYYEGEGRRFEFQMQDIRGVLSPDARWACWDSLDQLLIGRNGCIERGARTDFELWVPSRTIDLSESAAPGQRGSPGEP